jgi:hypothetical protein
MADPLMVVVWRDLREGLVQKLESLDVMAIEEQHEAALMLKLLKRVQMQFESYVQHGKHEEHKRNEDSLIQRMRNSIGPRLAG